MKELVLYKLLVCMQTQRAEGAESAGGAVQGIVGFPIRKGRQSGHEIVRVSGLTLERAPNWSIWQNASKNLARVLEAVLPSRLTTILPFPFFVPFDRYISPLILLIRLQE